MVFLKRIFGAVQPSYLIRAYAIGVVFFGFFVFLAFSAATRNPASSPYGMVALMLANLLFFPFSKLVFDEIKRVMMGDNILIVHIVVAMTAKLFINLLLFGLAIFIAPLGIIYLWFRTRS